MWGMTDQDKISQVIQAINDHSVQLNVIGAWIKGQIEKQGTTPDTQLKDKLETLEQSQEKLHITLTKLWEYVTKRLDNIEEKVGIKIGGEVKW
jgi:hypothetical protein